MMLVARRVALLAFLIAFTQPAVAANSECEVTIHGVRAGRHATLDDVCTLHLDAGRYALRAFWDRSGTGSFEVAIGREREVLWHVCNVFVGEESCYLRAGGPVSYSPYVSDEDDPLPVGNVIWLTIEFETTLVFSVGLLQFTDHCDCSSPLNTSFGAGRFVLRVSGPTQQENVPAGTP